MDNFEWPELPPLESSDEIGLNDVELVGETEIGGFESSGLFTDAEVAESVSETLPPSHLEGCPSITYEPGHPLFEDDPFCLAFFETDDHEIRVGPSERFENPQDMLETITHEIGHNVHQNMIDEQPDLAGRWGLLHLQSVLQAVLDGTGFVSDYATTNQYEDFAESYKTYVHDPDLLRFMSPDKYEFMRTAVFAGQEYPARNL